MNNFTRLSDEILVCLYQDGDDDAQNELIKRFQIDSKILAAEMAENFKDVTLADVEELCSIGLYSVFVAMRKYTPDKEGTFRKYWKVVATNGMMKWIKENSPSYIAKRRIIVAKSRYANEEFFVSSPITEEHDFMVQQINDIFSNSPNLFENGDKELFFDFINGYSYKEICTRRNRSYRYVRNRMEKIRVILSRILLNS